MSMQYARIKIDFEKEMGKMKEYKMAVLKIGSVTVQAEDVQEAKDQVQQLSMDQIQWLSKEEGDLENYLITGIEEKEIVEEEKNSMFELLKEQWDDVLLHAKEEHDIMDVSFATWLRPLKIYAVDGNVVKISAPDEQMLRYIKIKYGTILQVSIEEVTGFDCTVEFVTEDDIKKLSV